MLRFGLQDDKGRRFYAEVLVDEFLDCVSTLDERPLQWNRDASTDTATSTVSVRGSMEYILMCLESWIKHLEVTE